MPEITYEKLLYAAPIVNSIRYKWGFRGFEDPLSWAAFDGKYTYLSPDGTSAVLAKGYYTNKRYKAGLKTELFVGSHRDIASKTREFLFEYLYTEKSFELSEYRRKLDHLTFERSQYQKKVDMIDKDLSRLVASPSYDRYLTIKRKKNNARAKIGNCARTSPQRYF